MAINYSQQVYAPTYNTFSRPATFTPTQSAPATPAFIGRGIFSTQPLDVLAEDNSIFSDAVTILDILESEYTILPAQGDFVFIPSDNGMPELGNYEIIDHKTNGGGETTLVLRRVVTSKP